jgi:hypothetical protein
MGLAQEGSLIRELMDHTHRTMNFIFLTDRRLLLLLLLLLINFWSESHFACFPFACLYGKFHKNVCCTPDFVGECLLCSVVGIMEVAQKVWALPLLLNLIGCKFEVLQLLARQ